MPNPSTLGTPVPESTMRAPGSGVKESKFAQVASGQGDQTYALSIATVIQVDWEKHHVTLRTDNGETFENAPIMLTYPGAGARHFLGAMPMAGDVAVVGWGAGESGRSRQPYVLGWFASPTAGYDWWVLQPFSQDEYNLTPKDRETFEGLANRTRYKLRHMLPGNIVASSAQGSDLVLDESVTLLNRRGNEIRLRDQDQAIVFRSLQQFHAGAGFRVYSGIVQRDATLLPSSMFSDGVAWDAAAQLDADGNPLTDDELGASPVAAGYLTPNKVFQRDAAGNLVASFVDAAGNPVSPFGGNVDPYVFLQKGLFLDTSGGSLVPVGDAVYGGKAIYRVSEDGTNAVLDPSADALTEYRVEVSLTSNGTLPVTEQTDGFDADRLPDTVPRLPSGLNDSIAAPFIEFVMGSVVGNDPFSLPGRALYGVPIRPSIFSASGDTVASPTLGSGIGWDMAEHAAFLFRLTPPATVAAQPSFWSVTKDGRARVSVAGPGSDFSAEASFASGLRVAAGTSPTGESFRVDAQGSIRLRTAGGSRTGRGVEISSLSGTVYIRGAGQAGSVMPSGVANEPGVTVQSDTDLLMKASKAIVLSAPTLDLRDVSTIGLSANAALAFKAGDSISQSSKTRDVTTMGKSTESYSGPKDGLPTNGAVREVNVNTTPATGFVGGTADSYNLVYGDREETLLAGSHQTSVAVGNATYAVGVGTWTASSGPNTLVAGSAGVAVTAAVGAATFTATAGATTVSGSTNVLVTSAGPVVIRGTVVTLAAPGTKVGGIVSGADIDPIAGVPLALLGLGSPTHLLAAG
jgi:hypothetical protein